MGQMRRQGDAWRRWHALYLCDCGILESEQNRIAPPAQAFANAAAIAELPELLAVAERISEILDCEEWDSDTLGQLAEVQQWLDETVAKARRKDLPNNDTSIK